MKKKSFAALLALFVLPSVVFPIAAWALERVNFGTTFKGTATYEVVIWAAQEKGYWSKHGLEVNWLPFAGSGPMNQALAAGSLDMGVGDTTASIQAISRGVPVKIVADFSGGSYFSIYVAADGPIRGPADLRGAKLAVSEIGGASQTFALFIIRALKMEGEVKFIALRGLPTRVAALKTGSVQGLVQGTMSTAGMVAKGELRPIASTKEYLPREWSYNVILVRDSFAEQKGLLVKATVKAMLEAIAFVRENRSWTEETVKTNYGFSPAAAKYIAQEIYPVPGGKMNLTALENVRKFAIDYRLIPKEQAAPLERLYLPGFAE